MSASEELAKLVGGFMRLLAPANGCYQGFVDIKENAHFHSLLSQQGGCHDYSGLAAGLPQIGLDPEDVSRNAYAALLTSTTISIACAEHLRARLSSFSLSSPSEGAVLATAQGVEPDIARAITAWMPLATLYASAAKPLLALSFTRLAAIPALSLPHGRLAVDSSTGEIRLFPVADNKSRRVGAGRNTASTLNP